ncbi:hypothetical protein [Afipia felis]|uniref:Uncharacterized protein n=2 Tax=Afipia felis TaxID=1035 RepID=A0A380W748_AFIFE|nr:hypothetical protein [Afipia felis]EKS27966.1 hypothetical protein HMPREF9697_00494 [Afipia felis ATCC 53690]SUU76676.1 Uncharacterised protein [Afipia felis]SUU84742.1 Uncharacterised protein [Afipia felis]
MSKQRLEIKIDGRGQSSKVQEWEWSLMLGPKRLDGGTVFGARAQAAEAGERAKRRYLVSGGPAKSGS